MQAVQKALTEVLLKFAGEGRNAHAEFLRQRGQRQAGIAEVRMHVLINGSELLGVLPADALILMRLQQAEHLFPFGQQLGLVVLRLRQRADVDTGLLNRALFSLLVSISIQSVSDIRPESCWLRRRRLFCWYNVSAISLKQANALL